MKYGDRFRVHRKLTHMGVGMQQVRNYQKLQSDENKVVLLDLLSDSVNYVAHFERYAASVVSIIGFGRRISKITDPIITEVICRYPVFCPSLSESLQTYFIFSDRQLRRLLTVLPRPHATSSRAQCTRENIPNANGDLPLARKISKSDRALEKRSRNTSGQELLLRTSRRSSEHRRSRQLLKEPFRASPQVQLVGHGAVDTGRLLVWSWKRHFELNADHFRSGLLCLSRKFAEGLGGIR